MESITLKVTKEPKFDKIQYELNAFSGDNEWDCVGEYKTLSALRKGIAKLRKSMILKDITMVNDDGDFLGAMSVRDAIEKGGN